MRVRTRGEDAKVMDTILQGSYSQPRTYVTCNYGSPSSLRQFSILGVTFSPGVDFFWNGSSIAFTNDGVTPVFPSAKLLKAVQDFILSKVPLQPIANGEKKVGYETEVFTDVVSDHFTRRRNAGEFINNPMSSLFTQFSSVPMAGATETTGLHSVYIRGEGWAPGEFYFSFSSSAVTKRVVRKYFPLGQELNILRVIKTSLSDNRGPAIAGAFAKLQKADLDLALMAAEGRETYNFINGKLLQLAKILRMAQDPKTLKLVAHKAYAKWKRQVDKVGWTGKAAAEAYLEVRYALRPLMYDIEDLLMYYKEGSAKQRQNRYTYRKQEGKSQSGTYTFTLDDGAKITYSYSADSTARAGVIAEKVLDLKGERFGFWNLANIVWEKVKFSFILDWIIDLSGLLYRLNPNLTMKPRAAWVKVTTIVTVTGTYTPANSGPQDAIPFRISQRDVAREVVTEPPLVSINIDLDYLKVLDLIAIAGGLRRGRAPF